MKGKKKRNHDEVSYWEAMADNMTALLLFILLIMLLLVLYLVRIPDELHQEDHPYESTAAQETKDRDDDDDDDDDHDRDGLYNKKDQDSGGGGGSGGGKDTRPTEPEKGSDKAAVLVQLKDQETGKLVKVPGVAFELYYKNALRVLSTYYPEKIDYKEYVTTENGNFYLPEKIALTSYSLRSLSGLEGYYIPDEVHFTIKKTHDWKDPYLVTVELSPEKNVIKIQLRDRTSGHSLSGASFEVIAAEDITTMDDTVRYVQGEKVASIKLDENGYGESKELYLGQYILKQKKIPEFYAKITEPVQVTLVKQHAEEDQVQKVTEELTQADILIKDELNENQGIAGAVVSVKEGKEAAKSYTTDQNGRIHLTNLAKNTLYTIKQVSSLKNYILDPQEYGFTVSADGLIQDGPSTEIAISNRMIRVNIDVKDKLYQNELSDINLALKTEAGQIVDNWTSNGVTHSIEGLKPGAYQLIIDGKERSAYYFNVQDTKEIQEYAYSYWTDMDIFTVIGCILAAFLILIIAWVLIRSAKKKKA